MNATLLRAVVLFMVLGACLSSQTVTGIVTNENDEPLENAQVYLKELTHHDITDENGRYTLADLSPGNHTLIVSYIGYALVKQTVSVQDNQITEANLSLDPLPVRIEEILVQGDDNMRKSHEIAMDASNPSPKDIGEFFKTIPGASAIKKGGFAQDPVIRGNQKNQLNIQLDGGVKCWGGCPNRMDPPTAHFQAEDLEKVEIVTGPYSVRWGQTFGGIVNLVMKRPGFSSAFHVDGSISTGIESNSHGKRGRLTMSGGNKLMDFYLGAGRKQYGDYTAGNDSIVVPSSFSVDDYSTKIAINPSINHRFQLSYRYSRVADVDFPALPMDARLDETKITSMDYAGKDLLGLISAAGKIYMSTVYHKMDNADRPNFMMVEAETIADAITRGGRFEISAPVMNSGKLYFGMDGYTHQKEGNRTRYVKTNPCNTSMHPNITVTDPVWQNSHLSNVGFFTELFWAHSKRVAVSGGARFDRVKAEIREPSDLFVQRYGAKSDFSDAGINYFSTVTYQYNQRGNVKVSFGVGSRPADITERFVNHLPVGKSGHEHLGNPLLKPERNNQVDFALSHRLSPNHFLKASVFYSHLSDYILAREDSSLQRLYLPCSPPEHVKVFENIDSASKTGVDLRLHGFLTRHLTYDVILSLLRGHNNDMSEPLPEISPATLMLDLTYNPGRHPYWVSGQVKLVAGQDRISTSFGENETPGYNLLNLSCGYTFFERIHLVMDVANVLNETYYDHLSRSFAKNSMYTGLPLYEAGRNVKVQVEVDF